MTDKASTLDLGPLYEYGKRIGWEDVSERNARELQSAAGRIFEVLRDREWHSVLELVAVSKVMDTTRRIRDVREWAKQRGMDVETRPIKADGRTFEYRLCDRVSTVEVK